MCNFSFLISCLCTPVVLGKVTGLVSARGIGLVSARGIGLDSAGGIGLVSASCLCTRVVLGKVGARSVNVDIGRPAYRYIQNIGTILVCEALSY